MRCAALVIAGGNITGLNEVMTPALPRDRLREQLWRYNLREG